MSRLMILGGSVAQLNAVRHAQQLGHHVIVVDWNPEAPGASIADEFIRASTFDADAVEIAARASNPDGILVVATDQPVLIAAQVAERLGLPYPLDVETARLATNKGPMKRRLLAAKIPTPPFTLLDIRGNTAPGCPDLSALKPPYVVKPTDNQGQRGVTLVQSASGIAAALRRAQAFSRRTELLVEEYYPSREVTVSGWATDGIAQILTITDRVTINHRTSLGVCAAHRFPSTYAQGLRDEVVGLTRRVVSTFGIQRGPLYFQMLIGNDGVKVNEVACRVGGAFEDLSLPHVTGVDLLSRAIAESLGRNTQPLTADTDGVIPADGAFTVPLLYCEPGTIGALGDLSEAQQLPGIVAARWLQPVGRTIEQMRDSSQRVGFAIVQGSDRSAVNESLKALFAGFRVLDSTGRQMLMPTLDYCLLPATTR